MALTISVKINAIASRDTKLPPARLSSGRYETVSRIEISAGVFIGRDQYLAPERPTNKAGIGYIDYVEIVEKDVTHRNQVHTGPEKYRDRQNDVWVDISQEDA